MIFSFAIQWIFGILLTSIIQTGFFLPFAVIPSIPLSSSIVFFHYEDYIFQACSPHPSSPQHSGYVWKASVLLYKYCKCMDESTHSGIKMRYLGFFLLMPECYFFRNSFTHNNNLQKLNRKEKKKKPTFFQNKNVFRAAEPFVYFQIFTQFKLMDTKPKCPCL